MGVPGKKKDKRGVNEAAENWWVENMLPHESGGEDGTTAKDEEKESRRSLHETVNERCRKTSWAHCGCESNEDVDFLVQELELDAAAADRALREHNNDVVAATRAFL